MKIARGNVRRLIVSLGEIQGLVGSARSNMMNDRSPGSYEKALDELEKAFDICVSSRSEYYPVDMPRARNSKKE